MPTAIQLSESLIEKAKPYAQAMHQSVAEQIEYWARLGKVAEENPDLPIPMLQDMLVSMEEVKAGNLSAYQFGWWRLRLPMKLFISRIMIAHINWNNLPFGDDQLHRDSVFQINGNAIKSFQFAA